MAESTFQFAKRTDHGRVAFEAYVAVWKNNDRHVVVGAPTPERLVEFWSRLTNKVLDQKAAQKVLIVKADE